ncbi:MAG TPA: phosphoribosylamine--glycine ligase [Candidatus Acidoferrales bacterium]|nr:phosphoribosylamine--glycine ligase [Candidatus Acidoferrales bacterium]
MPFFACAGDGKRSVDTPQTRALSWLADFKRMKILVIGGGGREHALVWKLRQSASVERIWCAPGNDGIAQDAECVVAKTSDVDALAALAESLRADLTVVGPEQPLVLGIADEFARHDLLLLGPSGGAARLEGSKIFAKEFMRRHGIPTASTYGTFDSAAKAREALVNADMPVVVKADGLCAGKGVLVTSSAGEAATFITRLMESDDFGAAGNHVIIEECLQGPELSYIVLTDGDRFAPLAASRDYKRVGDGNAGPNTGGMGAISSDELLSAEMERVIQEKIVRPAIEGMANDGTPYRGFLYFGLMMTPAGPKVLEFNCRLGDPETEALVMRMNFDLAEALFAAAKGRLASAEMSWEPKASCCVVLAAEGYPQKPKMGAEISGLPSREKSSSATVFHAGTRKLDGQYRVNGGRVLTVAAAGESLAQARLRAYAEAKKISFEGMQYRGDIGGEMDRAEGEVARR